MFPLHLLEAKSEAYITKIKSLNKVVNAVMELVES